MTVIINNTNIIINQNLTIANATKINTTPSTNTVSTTTMNNNNNSTKTCKIPERFVQYQKKNIYVSKTFLYTTFPIHLMSTS